MLNRLCRWTLALLIFSASHRAIAGNNQPTTVPTTAPATNVATTDPALFSCPKFGFSIRPPLGWSQIQGASDEAISLVPDGQTGAKDLSIVPCLKVVVPVLPLHIPGMIPVGSVANGYVNDLRKQNPDLKVDERSVVSISGVSGRRVVTSYTQGKAAWRDVVICIVHKDRVFLILADCPVSDYSAVRAAFDGMVSSLKWIDKP